MDIIIPRTKRAPLRARGINILFYHVHPHSTAGYIRHILGSGNTGSKQQINQGIMLQFLISAYHPEVKITFVNHGILTFQHHLNIFTAHGCNVMHNSGRFLKNAPGRDPADLKVVGLLTSWAIPALSVPSVPSVAILSA